MTPTATCATCRFWLANYAGAQLGTCHRYAPRPGADRSDWAAVYDDEFCGEHEPVLEQEALDDAE